MARSVEDVGGSAELFQADLMSEAGCVGLVEPVSAAVDSLEVLVNNTGGLDVCRWRSSP